MQQKPYFLINNEALYVEQVLVEYLTIPIFFLCKSETDYYLALCTDGDAEAHYLVQITKKEIYDLLNSKITMREVFLRKSFFWNIISGNRIEEDIVTKLPIEKLDTTLLPDEGAYFVILTPAIKKYAELFEQDLLYNGLLDIRYQREDVALPSEGYLDNISNNAERKIDVKYNNGCNEVKYISNNKKDKITYNSIGYVGESKRLSLSDNNAGEWEIQSQENINNLVA